MQTLVEFNPCCYPAPTSCLYVHTREIPRLLTSVWLFLLRTSRPSSFAHVWAHGYLILKGFLAHSQLSGRNRNPDHAGYQPVLQPAFTFVLSRLTSSLLLACACPRELSLVHVWGADSSPGSYNRTHSERSTLSRAIFPHSRGLDPCPYPRTRTGCFRPVCAQVCSSQPPRPHSMASSYLLHACLPSALTSYVSSIVRMAVLALNGLSFLAQPSFTNNV